MSGPGASPGRGRSPLQGEDAGVVIGLEVHVQLRTRSKLFCACPATSGGAPNSRVCAVCLGLPGTLPLLNRGAVELAVLAAVGLGLPVRATSGFSRKHYFHPDLPKGYQITQHGRPLAGSGDLLVPMPDGGRLSCRLRGLHLEEDSGRVVDAAEGVPGVDFNRAGVPLVEIVTEPLLRSPAEARAFLRHLRQTLQYLEVSDCAMEEGEMRVDANVSLSVGGVDGERTEIKNLNSFAHVEAALSFEIRRQAALHAAGERPARGTRRWDAAGRRTLPLRDKEATAEYRYLPEPDVPDVSISSAMLRTARARVPQLPADRAARLVRDLQLTVRDAARLTASRRLADYFEGLVGEGCDARDAAAWVLGEMRAASTGASAAFDLPPARLAGLITLVRQHRITRAQAREVLPRMCESGEPADRIVEERGLRRAGGEDRLGAWVEQVLREHPGEATRYRGGDTRLLEFFMGRVMALSAGAADPGELRSLLRRRLAV